jgi:SAM-dependent methyltransferase
VSGFYDEDLAYIHHIGFASLVDGAGPELLAWIASFDIVGGQLIDLGCGSGTFSKLACDAGFDVLGVDLSPAMIQIAGGVATEADLRCASLFDLEFPPCRIVTMLGEGLNYCAGGEPDDRRIEVLFARVASALEPGGVFAFDVIVADDDNPMSATGARAGTDWAVISVTTEDLDARHLIRTITAFREMDGHYRRSDEVHLVRVFEASALAMMLKANGFAVEVSPCYGNYALLPRRRAFLARKI